MQARCHRAHASAAAAEAAAAAAAAVVVIVVIVSSVVVMESHAHQYNDSKITSSGSNTP